MKTSNLIILLVAAGIFLFGFTEKEKPTAAQSTFIEVTGSSEMEIKPDEVEFEIRLVAGGNGSIEKSEKKFFDVLENHGIAKDQANFKNLDYYNYWYYWWHRKEHEYKTFTFTLNEDIDIFDFVTQLDPNWVSHLRVSKTTHSKIQEYRKQVKIDAMKAAKEKATYLLGSVDEKPGALLEVIEVTSQSNQNYYWWNQQNLLSNAVSNYTTSNSTESSAEIDGVQAIKLRYEIKTKFEII